jgi:hypothetical protein
MFLMKLGIKKQKYIINYFKICSTQYFYIKTIVLKNLLSTFKNNKYIILIILLNIIAFIKVLVLKMQQYHIVDK